MFLILHELRKNRSEEGLQREIHEVIKTIVQTRAGKRNRKGEGWQRCMNTRSQMTLVRLGPQSRVIVGMTGPQGPDSAGGLAASFWVNS